MAPVLSFPTFWNVLLFLIFYKIKLLFPYRVGFESISNLRYSSICNFTQTAWLAIKPPTFFNAFVFPPWSNVPGKILPILQGSSQITPLPWSPSSSPCSIAKSNMFSLASPVDPRTSGVKRGIPKVSNSVAAISSLACGNNIQLECSRTPTVKISQGRHSARQSARSGGTPAEILVVKEQM